MGSTKKGNSDIIIKITPDDNITGVGVRGMLKLKEIQTIVDGFIEIVPLKGRARKVLGDNIGLIVNEEGKLSGLPKNGVASILANRTIRGTVCLVKFEGTTMIGLDKKDKNKVLELFAGIAD